MGRIGKPYGRITIETRRESFVIHPDYGWGSARRRWRESVHPEFLYDDMRDLIKALAEVAKARSL